MLRRTTAWWALTLTLGACAPPRITSSTRDESPRSISQGVTLGNMRDARVRHSATLLADGTVLVAGGASTSDANGMGTDALSSAELYVSSFRPFQVVSSLAEGRWAHTATLLHDGTVFLAGGFDADGNALSSTEIYQPDQQTFIAGPHLLSARGFHTATLLSDGRVLLIGGATGSDLMTPVQDAEVYDPNAGTLVKVGEHEQASVPNVSVLLDDGRVEVLWPQARSQELFTPGADSFQAGTPLPDGLGIDFSAVRLSDGSLELLLPTTSPPDPYVEPSPFGPEAYVILTPGGDVTPQTEVDYVTTRTDTGLFGSSWATVLVADEIFQLGATPVDESCRTSTLEDVNRMPTGLADGSDVGHVGCSWPTATALPDGSILAVGGIRSAVCGDSPTPTASAQRLFVTTWQEADEDLPDGDQFPTFSQAATTLLDNGEALFGEGTGSSAQPTLVDRISVFDGAHFKSIPLLWPRDRPTTLLLDSGTVLVAGGETTSDADEELFQPGSDATEPANFRLQARGSGIGLAGGRALFAGKDILELVQSDATQKTFSVQSIALTESLGCDHPNLVRLPNGRILVQGLQTLYHFDPQTRVLSPKASLQAPRCDAVDAVLTDGRVVLIGGTSGDNQGPSQTAELYDPVEGTVRTLDNTLTDLGVGVAFGEWFEQIVVGNYVLQLDPLGRYLSSLYHGETDMFGTLRATGSQVLLPDGRVLALPGAADALTTFSSVRLGADNRDQKFRFHDSPPHVRMGTSQTLAHGFSLYGAEGSSGTNTQSAASSPVPVWFPAVGGWPTQGTLLDWSDSSPVWQVPSTPFPGLGLLFVALNGKLSGLGPVWIDPSSQGSSCTLGGECETGYCVDKVCCDSACDGACQACTQTKKGAGADGECGLRAAGQKDPACAPGSPDKCGQDGTCDSTGNCALYEGTPCNQEAGICSAGVCSTPPPVAPQPDSCDGDHTVTLGDGSGTKDCGHFRCSLATAQCLEHCSSNGECVAGFSCSVTGSCELPLHPSSQTSASCRLSARHPGSGTWLLGLPLGWLLRRGRRRSAGRSPRLRSPG